MTTAFTFVSRALLFDSTSPLMAIMPSALRSALVLALAAARLSVPAAPSQPPADLIVTNARIYTVDESRPVVVAFAVRGGRVWVTGRVGDQNRWADTRFPSHVQLTAAVPDNPAQLERVDGHANFANRKAMDAAGVTRAGEE